LLKCFPLLLFIFILIVPCTKINLRILSFLIIFSTWGFFFILELPLLKLSKRKSKSLLHHFVLNKFLVIRLSILRIALYTLHKLKSLAQMILTEQTTGEFSKKDLVGRAPYFFSLSLIFKTSFLSYDCKIFCKILLRIFLLKFDQKFHAQSLRLARCRCIFRVKHGFY